MSLIAAYGFDEPAGPVIDWVGGHDFPLPANAVRDPGHTGTGLSKTAGGAIPVASPAVGQTLDRTVMCWLRGDSAGGVWLARWQIDTINSGGWGLLVLSGAIGVQARNASSVARPSVPLPADGGWHHYAGTYSAAEGVVRLYVDATEAASAALPGPLRVDADRVDIAEWSTQATVLDDLRIYDEALPPAEIATVMATPVRRSIPVRDATTPVRVAPVVLAQRTRVAPQPVRVPTHARRVQLPTAPVATPLERVVAVAPERRSWRIPYESRTA